MDASVVIPSLVRESLYPLLAQLLEQRFDGAFEVVVIAQPPGRIDRARLPADARVVVHEEPLGLGFGHYRNVGIEASKGRIIAWIDDDERPRDDRWLQALTVPIRQQTAQVVTAGSHIPLGQGYLADSISWLGLPGGAYPGFETMWAVDGSGHTTHLCSGNFAIDRAALVAAGGFDAALASGNEDTDLAARLRHAGIPIRYEPAATVIHETALSAPG
ncbi:MAG: glycosyltransferase [Xanthomonadaceae bacterium]|nr:glycosyltransferase [Xanthomonadaceae bacterium]